MEKLSDLAPQENAEITPQESDVLKKYFNATPGGTKERSGNPGWMRVMKIALYGSILFLVLANPWIDSLVCMVPYCGGNTMMLLGVKALLFFVLFMSLLKFVVG